MSVTNNSSFLGIKLHDSSSQGITNPFHLNRRHFPKRGIRRCAVISSKHTQSFRFPHFRGQNLNLFSGSRLNCGRESPFSRSKDLLSYHLTPLWKEGLLLIRASVYTAVISALCILAWYARNKAKVFVEDNLLPSVCSAISEHIQREFQFGKVRRISPLSITLESCSFGPHKEEFSCGEVPTVKVRLHPFASLRRGKLVIDALLLHPSVLIAQKKDYTWLGIPSSDGFVQRRSSTEDGIDHRTRTRRIAQEEAGAQWERQRDDAAREAAEIGYVVSEHNCGLSEGNDDAKEIATRSMEGTKSKSFFCLNEGKHDHHCVDTNVDYDKKHADLEKSFGVKFPGSRLQFSSRLIKGDRKYKFKRKINRSDTCASGVAMKRRILERSALAAHTYFCDQSHDKFGDPSSASGCFDFMNHDMHSVESVVNENAEFGLSGGDSGGDNTSGDNQNRTQFRDPGARTHSENENVNIDSDYLKLVRDLTLQTREIRHDNLKSSEDVTDSANAHRSTEKNEELGPHVADSQAEDNVTADQRALIPEDFVSVQPKSQLATYFQIPFELLIVKFGITSFFGNIGELISCFLSGPFEKLKSDVSVNVEDIVAEHVDGVDVLQSEGLTKILPVSLDSVHYRDATVMLLAYGDREVREMANVNGHVKFHNHYSCINVQLSGNCKTWRSDVISEDGGWLSANVFVDTIEQKWHANLKIDNLFVPLFERILEIPITWSKGRASGEVHLYMSKGETFPNFHGQLDVTGLNFQILDAPSCFSNISATLCFRGQRIFLHNANGWFGSIPVEASGDFGIHPEEGEFHLMCQVPGVEVNALMRTFKMRPLLFPLAGSVTALFNCQGPLDSPVFVGTGMVSRTFSSLHVDTPASVASEALAKSKESGALAAFDRVPFSYVSANFTFNTDNCVADLYGIRASLVDGGEIRGAGNAWICPEGEKDETAIDVNLSGSLAFEKIMLRYLPSYHHLVPLKFGVLNGETKLSGSLLRPRFDIKWTAPTAEGSFSDARGDVIISHDFITVNSASAAFDLYVKVQTSYADDLSLKREEFYAPRAIPFTVDGVELDLHMRGFEFFSLVSTYTLDFPRPLLLKATGRIKFQGKVLQPSSTNIEQNFDKNRQHVQMMEKGSADSLVGDVSISGLKLNQLMLAPQLSGLLRVSPECIKGENVGSSLLDQLLLSMNGLFSGRTL